MGLFKSLKKLAKKIFKGVKKVFSLPGKILTKIVGKKWAKRLMIAVAVFTGGMAIMSGVGGFLGGTGFFGRFVSGGQAFLKGLLNPIQAFKGGVAGAQAGSGILGTAEGFATGAAQGAGALPGVAGAAEAAGAATPGVTGAAGSSLPPGVGPPVPNVPTGGSGFLSKAADFAKSTGGGLLLAKGVEGFAGGKAAEVEQERRDEIKASRGDPAQLQEYRDTVNKDLDELPKMRDRMDERWRNARSKTFKAAGNYNDPYNYAAPEGA